MTDGPPPARETSARPRAAAGTPGNRWAIVSLVCGVLGFLALTSFVAIGAGVVGRRRAISLGSGRRAATLGLWLGVAWLIGFAVVGGSGWWVVRHGATFVADRERGRTVELVNRVANAYDAGATHGVGRLGASRVRELAEVIRPLDVCRDVSVTDAAFTNRDGVFGITFEGVARFDNGQWPLRARLVFDGTGWDFSELDWQ